ncbi:MAG: hypothetical protein DMG96_42940 [Acidobacteria bacterium]|nr:MAG: hypothetical protein DMG96_42940 [Acidobacteriota bacterium]
MLKRCTKRFVWSWVIPCFVPPLMPLLSQEAPRAATKPELTVVQIKVTDKKTGSAIDNADVRVKWGQQESDSSSATTNSKGIAKLTDVPRGIAVIRVIANGYDVAAPRVDLKKEEQPIKIELDKETHGHDGDKEAPPTE